MFVNRDFDSTQDDTVCTMYVYWNLAKSLSQMLFDKYELSKSKVSDASTCGKSFIFVDN